MNSQIHVSQRPRQRGLLTVQEPALARLLASVMQNASWEPCHTWRRCQVEPRRLKRLLVTPFCKFQDINSPHSMFVINVTVKQATNNWPAQPQASPIWATWRRIDQHISILRCTDFQILLSLESFIFCSQWCVIIIIGSSFFLNNI